MTLETLSASSLHNQQENSILTSMPCSKQERRQHVHIVFLLSRDSYCHKISCMCCFRPWPHSKTLWQCVANLTKVRCISARTRTTILQNDTPASQANHILSVSSSTEHGAFFWLDRALRLHSWDVWKSRTYLSSTWASTVLVCTQGLPTNMQSQATAARVCCKLSQHNIMEPDTHAHM